MFELRCTVRNCLQTLRLGDDGLTCERGHHFDRSKQGYWNLLQPQDRRSSHPGDSDDAVLARHRWLARGHASGLIERLRPWLSGVDLGPNRDATDGMVPRILDLGCGEGSFGPALFDGHAAGYCGIDLSKRAIKMAARGWPDATWVLANADRILPAADASVHRVISLFGRRPISEIHRVLVPGGMCVVAVPAEDDLIELREQVQNDGHRRRRWEIIVDEMRVAGLECTDQSTWRHQVELQADGIADALAMTYRAVRHSQQARLKMLSHARVTLAADLLKFRKADSSRNDERPAPMS